MRERCGDDLSRWLAELACSNEIDTCDPRAARGAAHAACLQGPPSSSAPSSRALEDGILRLRFGPRLGAEAELDANGEGALEAAQAEEAEERRLFFVVLRGSSWFFVGDDPRAAAVVPHVG